MQDFTRNESLQAKGLQSHDSLCDGLISEEKRFPICVDLDDTLVKTDMLWESLFALLKINLAYILLVPFWLLKGKAHLKQEITRRVTLDVTCLPYNSELLSFLIKARQLGCQLALVTASNIRIAQQIADHLGIFTGDWGYTLALAVDLFYVPVFELGLNEAIYGNPDNSSDRSNSNQGARILG